MGLAKAPEDLVDGLSAFLKDVGFNSSFVDDEVKNRVQEPLWAFVQRTLINPLCFGHKVF